MILKQRQTIKNLVVLVEPEKIKNDVGYSEYKSIHIALHTEGAIDQAKAEKRKTSLLKNIARFLRHLKKGQKLAIALKLRKNKP